MIAAATERAATAGASLSRPARDLDQPTAPALPRARTRCLLLMLGIGIWSLPFVGELTGADRTGAAGALALVASFGLAAVALIARSRRDLLLGESVVSFAVAGLVTVLVATSHPWIPGPDRRAVLIPIFGPLALLAALDLVTRASRASHGIEVAVVRSVAALIASVAHFVALDAVPAATALFLAVLPASAALPRSARVARRWLECAAFLAAVVFFLAPEIHDAVDPTTLLVTTPTVWAFLHRLVGIALGIVIAIAIASPEGASLEAAGADTLPVARS